jgi:predicted nucleic acid-binding Zn ribbon protein
MGESERLRNAMGRRRAGPDRATRLGDILSELMENRISPQQARFGTLAELWGELLPAELRWHCKLADISGGQLKVVVDSPSYANELRWCSSELLDELQRQFPRAKIKGIKFVVG